MRQTRYSGYAEIDILESACDRCGRIRISLPPPAFIPPDFGVRVLMRRPDNVLVVKDFCLPCLEHVQQTLKNAQG